MDQLERLLDLLGLFLDSEAPATFEEIRLRLRDAYDQGNTEAAQRMFERDKDALRDLGIPILTTSKDDWSDEHNSYVLPKDRYYLTEIDFTPEEISALLVASMTVGEGDDAEVGLRKLLFGADMALLSGRDHPLLAAGPDLSDARLAAIADAIRDGRSIRFAYRSGSGEVSERMVDPYSLVWRSGHYYLVGSDHDRQDIRCFRVSRMASSPEEVGDAGSPPEGFVARDHVSAGPWGPDASEQTKVTIAFSDRVHWWAAAGVATEEDATSQDGWHRVIMPGSLDPSFVSWILSFGPDARVEEPPALREAVIERLEGSLGNV